MIRHPLFRITVIAVICIHFGNLRPDAFGNIQSVPAESAGTNQIAVRQVKLLNQHLIGIYVETVDSRGVAHRIKSGDLKFLEINHQKQPFWYLDQPDQNHQEIEYLKGKFSKYFTSDFRQFKSIDQRFFRLNRYANRIQIYKPRHVFVSGAITDQKTLAPELEGAEAFQRLLFPLRFGLNEKSGEKKKGGVTYHQKPLHPNIKKLITKLKQLEPHRILSKVQTTESRGVIKRYLSALKANQKAKPKKQFKAFSEISKATLFNAEIINQTISPKSYFHQPGKVVIVSSHAMGNFKANSGYENSVNFIEKANGDQLSTMIVVPIPDNLIGENKITIKMSIKTAKAQILNYLSEHQLKKSDVEWLRQAINHQDHVPADKYLQHDIEVKQLFESNKFQALIVKTDLMLSDQKEDRIPLPLLANWFFLTAKSYEKVGDSTKAAHWYNKVIKTGPYSKHFQNAVQKAASLTNAGVFKE